ncbi:DUF1642 domain-containing protein [Streptococcus uberis]|uniref:DUF1642 domain-containing protein n=1 Tax=Streptococcus uberis TaxID=1349 RepID=UPI0033653CE5
MKIEEAKLIIKARSKEMAEINAINSIGHTPFEQAVPTNYVIEIIDKLDTQKPIVPKFVAVDLDRISHLSFLGKLRAICSNIYHMTVSERTSSWFANNEDLGLRALLYGYTVEKEKLYTVEIPNPNRASNKAVKKLMLFKTSADSPIIEIGFMGNPDSPLCKLTEAEIRKDFDWAWQWKKEVE